MLAGKTLIDDTLVQNSFLKLENNQVRNRMLTADGRGPSSALRQAQGGMSLSKGAVALLRRMEWARLEEEGRELARRKFRGSSGK